MKDFTVAIYRTLLKALKEENYQFQSVLNFLENPADRAIMLRHDVDIRKYNSLRFAKIQREMGIVGTYYFRIVPESYNENLIREIYDMGHEIGYHYEDMDLAKGNPQQAIQLFSQHLDKLRKLVPIHTICMHGSPHSKYDNKDIWNYYNYRDFDIKGEPYFDIDFQKILYLTDTGRRWDGHKVSVRDKVNSRSGISFHKTGEIIDFLKNDKFPDQAMFNFHPQRWTDNNAIWWQDTIVQLVKNTAKYWLIKLRQHKTNASQVSNA